MLEAITGAKRAAKWKTAYAQAMLDARDPFGRVPCSINSLQARTSRMSISDPALQQLPSRGDDAWGDPASGDREGRAQSLAPDMINRVSECLLLSTLVR